MTRRHWAIAALVLASMLVAGMALARPGGGGSYSGGGSSSGGGGGGGGTGVDEEHGPLGLFLELAWLLCVKYPVIGIPITIALVLVVYIPRRRRAKDAEWTVGEVGRSGVLGDFGPGTYLGRFGSATAAPKKSAPDFDAIVRFDPSFSRVVFEDFVYSLYAEVHRARGQRALDGLTAYLSSEAKKTLEALGIGSDPVETVIVGAMTVREASATDEGSRIVVQIESNYTEGSSGYYARERWTLTRKAGAQSRTPDRVRVFGCPKCGAAQTAVFAGICKHCSRTVNDGSFDWTVQAIDVLDREQRAPLLTADVEERGTDEPTIIAPDLERRRSELVAKDASFEIGRFEARVRLVFEQFQIAWSSRDLKQMRPFLSDALFTTQRYWVNAYLAQHLRNVTEATTVTKLEMTKIVSDAFFDSITLRIFANGLDYTLSDEGKVVAGSRWKKRRYSEYWTFIRGTKRTGPCRTTLECVKCGGPLDVNMAGECTYCNVKVTTGEFDWVLSRIEQDESYAG